MAEVLLALMDAGGGADKVVVLKRIWPDLATDPYFVSMFRDEAKLTIRLNHPNVVQTYEVVEDDEGLAIAMEYLHGQPLAGVLNRLGKRRDLSLPLRLRILVEALAGLHYAHELADYDGTPLGVVHRDVSPENVFLTYDGQVKLMDFGVAKTTAAASRTRPGAIKGKLTYLAPDYFRNVAIDRRADIFAVGVMLWELLAGQRMWQGMGEAQIVHHLAAGMPMPPLPRDMGRPRALDAICTRALAVEPEQRHATAADLELELEAVLVGAADSHARTLGRVVSHAFTDARAEREALITRALETGRPPVPVPLDGPIWARELDRILPTIDGFFDQTVVDRTIVAELPVPRNRARVGAAFVGAALAASALGLFVTRAQGVDSLPAAAEPATSVASSAELPLPPAAAEAPPPAAESPSHEPAVAVGSLRAPLATPSVARDDRSALRPVADDVAGARPHRGRRLVAARRAVSDISATPDNDVPETRTESAPFEEVRRTDKLRPASLRAIDESNPFK